MLTIDIAKNIKAIYPFPNKSFMPHVEIKFFDHGGDKAVTIYVVNSQVLYPAEARELADALIEAAKIAEEATV